MDRHTHGRSFWTIPIRPYIRAKITWCATDHRNQLGNAQYCKRLTFGFFEASFLGRSSLSCIAYGVFRLSNGACCCKTWFLELAQWNNPRIQLHLLATAFACAPGYLSQVATQ